MTPPSSKQAILVVGGGLGIGLCVVREILQTSPATVKLVVFGLDAAPELATLIEAHPGRLVSVLGNVGLAADRNRAIEACKTHMGGLDTLVYTAGTMGAIERTDSLDIDKVKMVYDVNVFGLISMAQLCVPYLRQSSLANPTNRACGKLIALSSRCDTTVTYMGWTAYCSSKAATTRFLAVLAHEERCIHVQGVYPHLTRTRMPEETIAGKFYGIMADDECQLFRSWSDQGDAIVEPPQWCGNAVAKLALGTVRGAPSGQVLYYDEHVPGSRL